MKTISCLPRILLLLFAASSLAFAQSPPADACPREAVGSVLPEPEDLRSQNGILKIEFAYRSSVDAQGLTRYCYIDKGGAQSPTLRVKPGDQVTLLLKNELPVGRTPSDKAMPMAHGASSSSCAGGAMTAAATNLHFHGLAIPPVCHQDDTLHTLIAPAESYEYKFQIPLDQPPGLYWYHPHIHGFVKAQILGGASGALVVEGLAAVNSQVSGLPERVLIIRDQDLIHPDAAPVNSSSMPAPQVLRDAEGDILNAGTGTGKPAKDLSLNFVPVPYPDYQPAVIHMKPLERQLWRVLNASAITYVDLQVLFDDRPQFLGLVALDGVSINANGNDKQEIMWKGHILLPPASRAEFIVKGPPTGARASLVTRSVDTGPAVRMTQLGPWRESSQRPMRPSRALCFQPRPRRQPSAATSRWRI